MRPFPSALIAVAALGVAGATQAETAGDDRLLQLEQRLQALEARNAELEQSLSDDHLRDTEPDLVTRLKAVEFQALAMQKQARMVESLEGIAAGLGITQVAQRTTSVDPHESQLDYRADAWVSLPGGEIGQADGAIFAMFRLGQGGGLAALPPSFSAPNAAAFSLENEDPDDSLALLAQAWYQLDIPLPLGGYKPRAKETLSINFGKIDPFLFFDQNDVADDETSRFLNSVFVHNPLLDAGGDIGADAYGFTPGVRVAYANERSRDFPWAVSAGVFGAGSGAQYNNSLQQPLWIVQAETTLTPAVGRPGNYRLYAWENPRATAFANGAAATTENHRGIGLSIDQRVTNDLVLFLRAGSGQRGNHAFDRAVTLGADIGGNLWNRAADGIGIAVASLNASSEFSAVSATLDSDADGLADFGWQADGAENVAEIYYRWRFNPQFELSPDLQWVRNPGADRNADDVVVAGVRVQLNF
jgi:hypothetical protein